MKVDLAESNTKTSEKVVPEPSSFSPPEMYTLPLPANDDEEWWILLIGWSAQFGGCRVKVTFGEAGLTDSVHAESASVCTASLVPPSPPKLSTDQF